MDLQSPTKFLSAAVWMAWSCILFLPAMRERYSYLIDILLLLLIFMDKQYTLIFVIEIISSILRYKYYLFNGAEVSEWQAVVYLAAWILLTWQVFAKKKGQSGIGIAEKSVGEYAKQGKKSYFCNRYHIYTDVVALCNYD